eukprot:6457950-Amphidinium_carterae.1
MHSLDSLEACAVVDAHISRSRQRSGEKGWERNLTPRCTDVFQTLPHHSDAWIRPALACLILRETHKNYEKRPEKVATRVQSSSTGRWLAVVQAHLATCFNINLANIISMPRWQQEHLYHTNLFIQTPDLKKSRSQHTTWLHVVSGVYNAVTTGSVSVLAVMDTWFCQEQRWLARVG